MKLLPILFVSIILLQSMLSNVTAQQSNYALRFYGNGVNDVDRIKIPVDAPSTKIDIGAEDFTIEWWMKTSATATGSCYTSADAWIHGNSIVDRDIYGNADYGDFGVSLMNGRLSFGVHNGTTGITLCGNKTVADDIWHHVAVQRRRSDGMLSLYVDGVLDGQVDGPDGDVSYRNNRSSSYPNDPYLVIGAEKHDAGSAYPSYRGILDEFRISKTIRYTGEFSRPTHPFSPDANTIALYHFDEGSGTQILDASSAPLHGIRRYGGSPAGPEYIASTAPFTTTPTGQISTPTSIPKVGDANNDSRVNREDYTIWLTYYGQSRQGPSYGDFNNNGVVNGQDYLLWLTRYES